MAGRLTRDLEIRYAQKGKLNAEELLEDNIRKMKQGKEEK